MRAVELFAGAGGMSMGLLRGGFDVVLHAEIEPHARAVLRYHWPDVALHGDVATLDGGAWRGVALVAGGSPCQDLSVAGRRAGLSGARSGLFYHQVRVWEESGAPYCLWENVCGALSSNAGRDFASVLSAFVGSAVDVPSDGWRGAGVAAGRHGVAAWRVLDLQHFGPPQRRRRVFVLAARTGGCDPAEVLAVGEGVCGHPAPRDSRSQGAAVATRTRVARGGGQRPVTAGTDQRDLFGEGIGAMHTHGAGMPCEHGAFAFDSTFSRQSSVSVECAPTVKVGSTAGVASPPAVLPTLTRALAKGTGHGGVDDAIGGAAGAQANANFSASAVPTLNTMADAPYLVAPTLNTTHFGKHAGSNQHVTEMAGILPAIGRPRRLMPVECERLMGWPDGHTARGVDEAGREYGLSDVARYRLCGNGVATPVAAWIAERLRVAHEALGGDA